MPFPVVLLGCRQPQTDVTLSVAQEIKRAGNLYSLRVFSTDNNGFISRQ